jgi:ArsR family transcriptional regulator, arsenate/arsenite/antimonite-responsive transcriptional repressor
MTAMDRPLLHPSGTTFSPDDLGALQAIAEPNRARIVELLGHGEHCVCDVGEALAMSPALVSHHLRVLRTSGLLRERRDGRWVLYALDLDRLARLRSTILEFLTPSDAAASACVCSDCGPTRESKPAPGDPLGRLLAVSGSAR